MEHVEGISDAYRSRKIGLLCAIHLCWHVPANSDPILSCRAQGIKTRNQKPRQANKPVKPFWLGALFGWFLTCPKMPPNDLDVSKNHVDKIRKAWDLPHRRACPEPAAWKHSNRTGELKAGPTMEAPLDSWRKMWGAAPSPWIPCDVKWNGSRKNLASSCFRQLRCGETSSLGMLLSA